MTMVIRYSQNWRFYHQGSKTLGGTLFFCPPSETTFHGSSALDPTIMTSSKKARAISQFSLCNTNYIALLNVAGALKKTAPTPDNFKQAMFSDKRSFFWSSGCILFW